MNNNLNNTFQVGLVALAFSCMVTNASATCTLPPDCATLGFTKTAADCSGKTILKCPFNQSQVYCPSAIENEKTYALGDTYMKDGIVIGRVIAKTCASSRCAHGTIATVGARTGTPAQATAACEGMNTGGLTWYLPDGAQYKGIWDYIGSWRDYFYGSNNMYYGVCGSSCYSYPASPTTTYGYHCVAAF